MHWDLDLFIETIKGRQLLSEPIIKELCERTKEVLLREGNVRSVQSPVTIVGDVHGQYYDVLEIFKISGECPQTNYIFLGDYVDRGYYSVETITLLACLKLRYPDRVTLVRGNHESRAVTRTYGFYTECLRKYGSALVWQYFTDMFDYLVLSVVIDDSIFCVHGGLSPSIHTLDQIKIIDRFREIPHEGPMADLVWSDPIQPSPGAGFFLSDSSSSSSNETSLSNYPASVTSSTIKPDFNLSPRGAGYLFGPYVTQKFLQINGLSHLCRAHQLCMEGYQILFNDTLSTVWSAPNYCYRCGNLASVLEINTDGSRRFNVFGPCPESERDVPKYGTVSNGLPFRGGNSAKNNSFRGVMDETSRLERIEVEELKNAQLIRRNKTHRKERVWRRPADDMENGLGDETWDNDENFAVQTNVVQQQSRQQTKALNQKVLDEYFM